MQRLGRFQRGASIWMVMLMVIVLGFAAIFALKLVPIYLEWFKVEKALEGTLDAGAGGLTRQAIKDSVIRRLDINEVRRFNAVNFEKNFTISKKGQRVTIEAHYDAEESLFYNIFVVVKFDGTYNN